MLVIAGLDGIVRAGYERDRPDGLSGGRNRSCAARRIRDALAPGSTADYIRFGKFRGIERLVDGAPAGTVSARTCWSRWTSTTCWVRRAPICGSSAWWALGATALIGVLSLLLVREVWRRTQAGDRAVGRPRPPGAGAGADRGRSRQAGGDEPGAAGEQGKRRCGEPGEVAVPGAYEPRAAHAAARDHRVFRTDQGPGPLYARVAADSRLRARHLDLRAAPAGADQFHPGYFESRVGDGDAGRNGVRGFGPDPLQPRFGARAGAGTRHLDRGAAAGRQAERLGGPHPASAGADQPAVQCGEVYPGQRQDRPGGGQERGRRAGAVGRPTAA